MDDELMQRINDLIRKYKLMPERIASPPHRTNQKYLFNVSNNSVFFKGKYIGQGVLKENTLYVTQYQDVDIEHFSPNRHLN